MSRYLPIAVCVVLLAVCTAWQGTMVQRWTGGTTGKMEVLAKHYDEIPMTVGSWDGVGLEDDTVALEEAGAMNSFTRIYTNRDSGEQVTVFMICGFPRHVAVHTPDVCFLTAGMNKSGDTISKNVDHGEKTYTFYTAAFHGERDGNEVNQRTYWAWNNGNGGWKAPENPRTTFRGVLPLNKMYITVSNLNKKTTNSVTVAEDFAKAFLPVVDAILYPPVEESSEGETEESNS